MGKRRIQLFLPIHQFPHVFLIAYQFLAHLFKGLAQPAHLIPAVIGDPKVQIISSDGSRGVFQNSKRRSKPPSVKKADRHNDSCQEIEERTPHPDHIQYYQPAIYLLPPHRIHPHQAIFNYDIA